MRQADSRVINSIEHLGDRSFDHGLVKRAVVIGGSIAGLLSARVLSDYFERELLSIAIDYLKPLRRAVAFPNLFSPTFYSPKAIVF